jgi:hypothetical protein
LKGWILGRLDEKPECFLEIPCTENELLLYLLEVYIYVFYFQMGEVETNDRKEGSAI